MTTWLDRLRGAGQGRMKPESFTAPGGEHVFVLGADAQIEPAVLGPGDFTEIKQLVDLTGWDIVAATMDTVGVVMGQSQKAAGFPEDPDAIWWFNYDVPVAHAENLVVGAFGLDNEGEVGFGIETYSPGGTYCRRIPAGVDPLTRLVGQNTPQFFPTPTLPQHTIQGWMYFDADAHLTSWGRSADIFYCRDGVNGGFILSLSGASGPGAHSWRFSFTHYNGGGAEGLGWTTPVFTATTGWFMFTIVFDASAPPFDRLKLYINDNPVPFTTMAVPFLVVAEPAAGTPIYVAHRYLYGYLDEMRMLARALTPAEIAEAYLATTTPATPVDYEWVMQIIINAEVYAERVIRPGERRRWRDFRAPVRHLSGVCEVGFRLELREV